MANSVEWKSIGEPCITVAELVRKHILAELTVPRTDGDGRGAGVTKSRKEALATYRIEQEETFQNPWGSSTYYNMSVELYFKLQK